MGKFSIIDTSFDNISKFGVCGYKNPKKEGFPEKQAWLRQRFNEGLKIKTLYSEEFGSQGMIEYIPGDKCWRPVDATGYMFIHCIHVGFKKQFKGHGYASDLIQECIKDAKNQSMKGVAVVTRKGSFMVDKQLFLKNGFELVEKMKPDFELLVYKFDPSFNSPRFKSSQCDFGQGVIIVRAFQCPYTVKNVREMVELAAENDIKVKVIDLKSCEEAQNMGNAFGVFGLYINGEVKAEHPISKTRFRNILKTEKLI
jgi:predicted GNAT family acetyltransferase